MKRKRAHPQPTVTMERIPVPDAQERLARTFDLILRAAERADTKGEQGEGAGERGDEDGGVPDVPSR